MIRFVANQIRINAGRAAVTLLFAAALSATAPQETSADVVIDWANVANPGNVADNTGHGSVPYNYRIAKHETTNAQYAEFLNMVDPQGVNPWGLYDRRMETDPRGGIKLVPENAFGSKYEVKTFMGNKPVNYVNYLDAARFANWMNNGQGTASTETGAYDMTLSSPVRLPGAKIFLPSLDEWYKAAYHDPVNVGADGLGTPDYWLFPTMSDAMPTQAIATTTGDVSNPGDNVANYDYGALWNGTDGNVTTIGTALSASFYGLFDMGGNVYEWTDTPEMERDYLRAMLGGSWESLPGEMQSGGWVYVLAGYPGVPTRGFRLASVSIPEQILPFSFSIVTGTLDSGGLPQLMQSEDQYLVMDPVFTMFRYQLVYTVDATAPTDSPSALEFNYESKTFNIVGTVDQKIELFDYDNAQFETIDTRQTTLVDSVVTITSTGDPTRFVEAGTGAMRARISYQNSLSFWVFVFSAFFLPFETSVDHIFWTITP